MEAIKIIGLVLGASGIWKVLELIVKSRLDKKKEKAETNNLNAVAEKQRVESCIQWCESLEERLTIADKYNKELKEINDKLNTKIRDLTLKIEQMEKANSTLTLRINQLLNKR